MRLLSILPIALAVTATAAAAQQPSPAKTPSVADYLCTFAHKCDGDSAGPVETMKAPRTRGFRLARTAAPTPASSPSTRMVATPRDAQAANRHGYPRDAAAPVGRHSRYTAPAVAAHPSNPGTGAAGTGRPRADLMIGFELNSARLSGLGMASARVFAQSLLTPELSGKRFLIEGHTDLRGGRALNMDLSQRRAQAVADFLVAHGVDRSRLTTRGLGPDVPLAGHVASDPDNRRVEAELGS